MKKSEARIIYKQQRQTLSQKALNVKQDLLLIQFQQMVLPYAQIVHAYIPKASSNEPDPGPMVDWMKFRDLGLQVSYAKIDPSDMSMHHFMQHEEMGFEETKNANDANASANVASARTGASNANPRASVS